MNVVYRINGKRVTSEQWDAYQGLGLKGVPMGTVAYSESKPLCSEGLGCMRAQVPEMRQIIKERQIQGARVLDNGSVEFTSRAARRELLRVRGFVDNDGGYGDG